MKNSNLDRPRPGCRLARAWTSVVGESRWATRHIESCEGCREHLCAGEALDAALRRDAALEMKAAPAGFERRIMEEIDRMEQPRRTEGSRRWLPALALGGAAAAAAVAVFLQDGSARREIAVADVTEEVAAAVALVGSLPDRVWETLTPPADALLVENPLQAEVRSVYADAQTAVRFLAMNFLPSSGTAPAGDTAGG